jgi:hypothetical protein
MPDEVIRARLHQIMILNERRLEAPLFSEMSCSYPRQYNRGWSQNHGGNERRRRLLKSHWPYISPHQSKANHLQQNAPFRNGSSDHGLLSGSLFSRFDKRQ